MARREGQALSARFESPFVLNNHETHFSVTDRLGKVVAQGSLYTMKKHHPDALPSPFASSPPKGKAKDDAIEITVEKKGGTVSLKNFASMYAAKHWLNAVIKKDKYKWLKRDRIEVATMEIHSPDLEDIIEHDFTPIEALWELPEPYVSEAAQLRGDKKGRSIGHADGGKDMRESKGNRAAGKKPVPDGMISIADLCTKLKIEPRIARGVLRKKFDKPEHGWAWSKKDAEKVEATLKKECK